MRACLAPSFFVVEAVVLASSSSSRVELKRERECGLSWRL